VTGTRLVFFSIVFSGVSPPTRSRRIATISPFVGSFEAQFLCEVWNELIVGEARYTSYPRVSDVLNRSIERSTSGVSVAGERRITNCAELTGETSRKRFGWTR
jgi:hypothetical protein